MSARKIHYRVDRIGSWSIARCGVRFDADDSRKLMTTARGILTCQRCRNFLAIDGKKPKPIRRKR